MCNKHVKCLLFFCFKLLYKIELKYKKCDFLNKIHTYTIIYEYILTKQNHNPKITIGINCIIKAFLNLEYYVYSEF